MKMKMKMNIITLITLIIRFTLQILSVIKITESLCNVNLILSSETQECDPNTQECFLNTNTEVTFSSLNSSICLSLESFNLNITLNKMKCQFNTFLEYYTFPVKMKVQSEIVCPQNAYCSWGKKCRPGYVPSSLRAYTNLTGGQDCQMIRVGSLVCILIHRNACGFFKYWFEPDSSNVFEVRKISSFSCEPYVTVSFQEKTFNGPLSTLKLKDITIQHINPMNMLPGFDESLIVKTALERYHGATSQYRGEASLKYFNDAYFSRTAASENPVVNMIGDIQSKRYFPSNFLFAHNLVNCRFTGTDIYCEKKYSPIDDIEKQDKIKLPIIFQNHYLKYEKDLVSELLDISYVRLSVQFRNYSMKYFITNVCPEINTSSLKIFGCFNCKKPAVLTFIARSTCQTGRAAIILKGGNSLTKSIQLSQDNKKFSILFHVNNECPRLELCIIVPNKPIICVKRNSLCLEQPIIDLNIGEKSYTEQDSIFSEENFLAKIWNSFGDLWRMLTSWNFAIFFLVFVILIMLILCKILIKKL